MVDAAIEDDRVGVSVESQERRKRLDPVVHVAYIDHAGVVGHEV